MDGKRVNKTTKLKESFSKLRQGDKIILQCSYEKKTGMFVDYKLNVKSAI